MSAPHRTGAVLALLMLAPVASAQSEWQSFASDDGQFEAMFPQAPKPYTDRRIARNRMIVTSRVMGAGDPRSFCMAGYSEYSRALTGSAKGALDIARDDFADSTYATVLESREVPFTRPPNTELPAIRFIAIADERRYTSIMALEGSRFYQVTASTIRFGFSEADIARCLDGFKLKPAQPPP